MDGKVVVIVSDDEEESPAKRAKTDSTNHADAAAGGSAGAPVAGAAEEYATESDEEQADTGTIKKSATIQVTEHVSGQPTELNVSREGNVVTIKHGDSTYNNCGVRLRWQTNKKKDTLYEITYVDQHGEGQAHCKCSEHASKQLQEVCSGLIKYPEGYDPDA